MRTQHGRPLHSEPAALRRAAVVLCLCATALVARLARAEAPERPVLEALRVEPNACFDGPALAVQVAGWLHRDRIDRRIVIDVRGDPHASDGIELTVLRDERVIGGRRFGRFSVPCEEVRAAVSLAVALAVDATVLDSLGAKARAAPSRKAPPASDDAPPPAHAEPRARAWAGASLDAFTLLGVLPTPVVGLAPGVEVFPLERLHVHLGGFFTTRSTLAIRDGSAALDLLAGRLLVCPAFRIGSARLRACAGLAAGRLGITAAGFHPSYAHALPWVAPIARVDLRLALTSRIGLKVGAEGVVPVVRRRLDVVDDAGSVKESKLLYPAGLAIGVGPDVIF